MKTLYCLRHGESVENVEKIYTAGKAPLTKKGRQQAKKAADFFADIKINKLFASHYLRAIETANELRKSTRLKLEILDFVYEHAYLSVDLEGLHQSDERIKKIHTEVRQSWQEDRLPNDLPAETYNIFLDRVDNFIDFINKDKNENILFVGHAFFIKLLISRVLLGDLLKSSSAYSIREAIILSNAGVTIFEIDDNTWSLRTINLDTYL